MGKQAATTALSPRNRRVRAGTDSAEHGVCAARGSEQAGRRLRRATLRTHLRVMMQLRKGFRSRQVRQTVAGARVLHRQPRSSNRSSCYQATFFPQEIGLPGGRGECQPERAAQNLFEPRKRMELCFASRLHAKVNSFLLAHRSGGTPTQNTALEPAAQIACMIPCESPTRMIVFP